MIPHGHTHGIIDPSITTSGRGLWAIKWSFVGLAATAVLQLVVVIGGIWRRSAFRSGAPDRIKVRTRM
jgi:hypothetical protein